MFHECVKARKQLIARKSTSLACRQLPACFFPQISEDLRSTCCVYAKSALQKPQHTIILLLSLNSTGRQSQLLSTGWQLQLASRCWEPCKRGNGSDTQLRCYLHSKAKGSFHGDGEAPGCWGCSC